MVVSLSDHASVYITVHLKHEPKQKKKPFKNRFSFRFFPSSVGWAAPALQRGARTTSNRPQRLATATLRPTRTQQQQQHPKRKLLTRRARLRKITYGQKPQSRAVGCCAYQELPLWPYRRQTVQTVPCSPSMNPVAAAPFSVARSNRLIHSCDCLASRRPSAFLLPSTTARPTPSPLVVVVGL